jgi:hypothetical protein
MALVQISAIPRIHAARKGAGANSARPCVQRRIAANMNLHHPPECQPDAPAFRKNPSAFCPQPT